MAEIYQLDDQNRGLDTNGLLAASALANGGGFGGGMNNPLWMMFMYPFILPFLSMFGGYGGFGGFGGFGGGAGNLLGTGFLSNQLNNNNDKETILNALQNNREAISQLANQFGTSISDVQNNIAIANSKLADIGAQVGMSGMQVINAIQNGNAALAQQLCNCCCENRLAIVEQTKALQAQAAQNASQAQLQLANHDSNVRLQLAQNEAADQLSVCQQTNALSTQADRNTNSTLGAIAALQTNITKEFCEIKEREMQDKINAQGDIITQLRGQIDNANQTAAITGYVNSLVSPIAREVDDIKCKLPSTVSVQYPNLVALNATPYVSGGFYPNNFNNGFFGGFGGNIGF